MSAVASQNVSQELYGLSGWDGTDEQYHVGMAEYCPAYDLGYLLRKLPAALGSRTTVKKRNQSGAVYYFAKWDNKRHELAADASTPEDAAAKLAIELFKQGILVKDGGEVRG